MKRKRCNICKELKALDKFYPRKGVPDGLAYHCKDCQHKLTTAYRRKKEFGIDAETYNKMVKKCDGKCQICRKKCDKQLAIDHCHKTGKIRGLLCGKCNKALGLFKDSPKLLAKAIKYLIV